MRPEDVLGVPAGASPEVVHSAYRRALRAHHPDRHASAEPNVRAEHGRCLRAATDAWRALGSPRPGAPGPTATAHSASPPGPRSDPAPGFGTEFGPDDLDPEPYRPGHAAGAGLAVLPAGLFALAVASFVVAVMFDSPVLWLASGAALLASLALFALLPFWTMVRRR